MSNGMARTPNVVHAIMPPGYLAALLPAHLPMPASPVHTCTFSCPPDHPRAEALDGAWHLHLQAASLRVKQEGLQVGCEAGGSDRSAGRRRMKDGRTSRWPASKSLQCNGAVKCVTGGQTYRSF